MKFLKTFFLVVLFINAGNACLVAEVLSVRGPENTVELYARADYSIRIMGHWDNPYRSKQVSVDLVWIDPRGISIVIPCYFDSNETDVISLWKARFAPLRVGIYRGYVRVNSDEHLEVSTELELQVVESSRKGFLRASSNWSFRFDDGSLFRGIGENIGWESRSNDDSKYFKALHEDPRFHYEFMLKRLKDAGGNFFRTWMCAWNLPLEWHHVINTNRYQNDASPLNSSAMVRLDELVDWCDANDVFMMLTLDHAGSYIGGEWELNSYFSGNGGPVEKASQFFTDEAAKAQYKDRLRYIVARWGYSPAIAVFEFFNEIDHVCFNPEDPVEHEVISAWHKEMAEYLKSIDPWHHLVSTSVSHRDIAGLNQIEAIDFNQRHMYGHTPSIPGTIEKYAADAGKPYVIGEFAYEWDWSKNFNDFAEQMDEDFRVGLWLGLFSPTPVLPMSWWWEYFDERDTINYLAPVAKVNQWMLQSGRGTYEILKTTCRECKSIRAVRCGDDLYVYALFEDVLKDDIEIRIETGDASYEGSEINVLTCEVAARERFKIENNTLHLVVRNSGSNDNLWVLSKLRNP